MEERKGEKGEKRKERWITAYFKYIRKLLRQESSISLETEDEEEDMDSPRENPYLYKLRAILEQVLTRYGISYREFCPLLIDTDMPPESLLDEDQVEIMLEQISQDLNFLRIITDRPAYFTDYVQRMYEDSGLVVQICPKGQYFFPDVNVIFDMEQKGDCPLRHLQEHMIYIPVYKRKWEHAENPDSGGSRRNLDISIPIGYNTVIVKGV